MKRKHGGQFLKMIGGLYVLTTAFLYGKQSSYRPFIDISPQPNEGLQDSNRYLKDFKTVEDIIQDIEDTESKEPIQLETFFKNLTSHEDSSTYLTKLAQELFDHKDNQNIKAFISQLVTYITNNKKELEKSFDQETIRLLLEGLRNTGTEGNQTVITSQAPINTTDVNFTLPDTGTPTTGTPTTGTPTTGTSSLSTVFTDHNTQTTTTISSTDGTTTITFPKANTVTHNKNNTITVTTTNGNIFTINPQSSTIATTGTSAGASAVTSEFIPGTSVSIMPTTNKQDNITTYQVTNTGTPTTGTPTTGTPTFSTVSTDHNTQTTTISSTDGTTTVTFPKANTVTHNKNNTITVTTTEGKIFTINPQSSTITTTGTSAGTSEFHYKTRTHVFLTSTTPPFIVRKSTTGSQSIEFLLESTSTTPQPQQTFPVTTTQGLDGLFKHTITTHDGSLLIATTSSKELLPISSPQQETSSSLAGSIGGGVAGAAGVLGLAAAVGLYLWKRHRPLGGRQQQDDLRPGVMPVATVIGQGVDNNESHLSGQPVLNNERSILI